MGTIVQKNLKVQLFLFSLLVVFMQSSTAIAETDNVQDALKGLKSGDRREKSRAAAILSTMPKSKRSRLKNDPVFQNALFDALQSETELVTKNELLRAVVKIGGSKCVPTLSNVAINDPIKQMRVSALSGLVQISTEAATPVLRQAWQKDLNMGVKVRSAAWLAKFGDTEAHQFVKKEAMNTSLTDEVRAENIQVYGEIAETESAKDLEQIYRNNTNDISVRRSAGMAFNSVTLRGLQTDTQKIAFLRQKVLEGEFSQWACARLVEMKSIGAAQVLLDIAKMNSTTGVVSPTIQRHALMAFRVLYNDNTPQSFQQIDQMYQSGVVIMPPHPQEED